MVESDSNLTEKQQFQRKLRDGFNDDAGKVIIEKLTTNDIYTNGMIPAGQPNLITGAIFYSERCYCA